MDRQRRWSAERVGAVAAIAVGLTAGTYGIASAASGSGSSGASGSSSSLLPAAVNPAASAPNAQRPWGRQRSDETLLSGDTRPR